MQRGRDGADAEQSRRGWVRRPAWWVAAVALVVWLTLLALTLVPEWRAAAAAKLPWMLSPLYHDWHVVRLGWMAATDGVDPLASPSHPFNYPRVVLAPAWVGAHAVPADVAGLLLAAAALGVLVFLLWPATRGQALAAAALIASPPVLLLLERGNLDALVLVLVITGLAALATGRARGLQLAGVAALLLAALVKWYPAAALLAVAAVWRDRRRYWLLGAGGAVVLMLLLHTEEVAAVMQKTTRGLVPAYGRMLLGSRYYVEVIRPAMDPAAGPAWLRDAMQVSLVCCLSGYAVAAVTGMRVWRRFAALGRHEREAAFFLAGAAVFAGTFLLGNNWSYRLVFLLLTVPLLWRMWGEPGLRPWGGIGLAAVALTMLSPFVLPLPGFLFQQAVAWLLAFGLVAVLAGLAIAMAAGRGRRSPRGGGDGASDGVGVAPSGQRGRSGGVLR